MLKSLIVGFGKAGRGLHLHCLRKARQLYIHDQLFDETVGVVDPRMERTGPIPDNGLLVFHHLRDVQGFEPASTVVHICTPPAEHLTILQEAAEMGYTRIVVEKPLTTSMRGVEAVLRLQQHVHLDVLVMANWLFSSLTRALKDLIDSKQFGCLLQLTIEQHKPRFVRTLLDTGHITAFDVEIPHQVALALYLGQGEVNVGDATCTDMRTGTAMVPYMGSAGIELLHDSGMRSSLYSDLTASRRMRFVRLSFDHHSIEGSFPLGENSTLSHLTIRDSSYRILHARSFQDDPLTTCFIEYYRYYSGKAERPISDLPFGAACTSIIIAAKVLAGVPIQEENYFHGMQTPHYCVTRRDVHCDLS